MKLRNFLIGAVAVIVFAAAALVFAPAGSIAQTVGDQNLIRLRFVTSGPTANGNNALQVGEVSTLSAEVTNTTVTQVVAAPAAGLSIYVRGIIVTKSVAATGAVTLVYGTGTNCGTGTTTLLTISGATSNSLVPGYIRLGIQVPAAKALCLNTEAAGTGVRALTN